MDGARGYYAKWNKSDRERQISNDFTSMWSSKNKINEQNRNKLLDTENKLMVTDGKRVEGLDEKGERD